MCLFIFHLRVNVCRHQFKASQCWNQTQVSESDHPPSQTLDCASVGRRGFMEPTGQSRMNRTAALPSLDWSHWDYWATGISCCPPMRQTHIYHWANTLFIYLRKRERLREKCCFRWDTKWCVGLVCVVTLYIQYLCVWSLTAHCDIIWSICVNIWLGNKVFFFYLLKTHYGFKRGKWFTGISPSQIFLKWPPVFCECV